MTQKSSASSVQPRHLAYFWEATDYRVYSYSSLIDWTILVTFGDVSHILRLKLPNEPKNFWAEPKILEWATFKSVVNHAIKAVITGSQIDSTYMQYTWIS